MSVEEPLWHWAINLVMVGLVGLAGFLLRKTFSDFAEQLKTLGSKVDELRSGQGDHGTSVRLLEQQVSDLRAEATRQRERTHELAQRVTWMRARIHSSSGTYPAVSGGDEP